MHTLLKEMAVRAVSTECTFAETAFGNVDLKAAVDNDLLFSSIHSFLSHCANVSKWLKSNHLKTDGRTVGEVLGITDASPIHNRWFRNSLEHYDKTLAAWVQDMTRTGKTVILDYNVGPPQMIKVDADKAVIVRHYDPNQGTYTLIGKELNLSELKQEISEIKALSDTWLAANRQLEDIRQSNHTC